MRALVLAGGGAKGAYQVGVLRKWIEEDGHDYRIIVGTSVGCINGVKLAHAKVGPGPLIREYGDLKSMWEELNDDQVYESRWLCGISSLWNNSVFLNGPLRQLLRGRIDPERLKESGREFRGVYVSWETGEVCTFNQTDENPAQKTYFSASFPVFFQPGVGDDGKLYTDGGLRDIAPLGQALKLGATSVDMILCSNPDTAGEWCTRGRKSLGFAMRAVDIQSTEILLNDVRVCKERNRTAKLMSLCKANGVPIPDDPDLKEAESFQVVDLRVLSPSGPVGESFDFSPEANRARFELGYEDACTMG